MEAQQQQQCGSSAVCGKPPPTPDTNSSFSKTPLPPCSRAAAALREKELRAVLRKSNSCCSPCLFQSAQLKVSCRSLLIYCTAKLRSSTWTKTPETEFANASCEILAGAWSWEKCKKGKSGGGDCIRRRRGGVDLAGIW